MPRCGEVCSLASHAKEKGKSPRMICMYFFIRPTTSSVLTESKDEQHQPNIKRPARRSTDRADMDAGTGGQESPLTKPLATPSSQHTPLMVASSEGDPAKEGEPSKKDEQEPGGAAKTGCRRRRSSTARASRPSERWRDMRRAARGRFRWEDWEAAETGRTISSRVSQDTRSWMRSGLCIEAAFQYELIKSELYLYYRGRM